MVVIKDRGIYKGVVDVGLLRLEYKLKADFLKELKCINPVVSMQETRRETLHGFSLNLTHTF
jgi:hypothetical protein